MSNGTFTGQGSAYVYREYTRLVQADMNKILSAAYPNRVTAQDGGASSSIYNHPIGDPACFVDPATAFAAGCTGLEGLAIQAPQPTATNPNPVLGDPTDGCSGGHPAPICNNYTAGSAFMGYEVAGYGASVLRSGFDYAIFCQNPADVPNEEQPFYNNCNAASLWAGALGQVQMVAGQGVLANLPAEISDIRYYFRWYGIAMIKYLRAYGAYGNATTAALVEAQTMDLESMFFDSNTTMGGYDDDVEYIDRAFMTDSPVTYTGNTVGSPSDPGAVTVGAVTNAVPMDFVMMSNVLAGQVQLLAFSKFMYRQETAMFQAMLENKGDLPASENNVNITNLAGSQLLQQNYPNYECATQYPTVTIQVPNGKPITGAWDTICGYACPSLYLNGACPTPPLNTDSQGNQTLQLDLNGSNPGLGLGGSNARLAAYKSVWGRGAACADPTKPNTPNYALDPWEANNNPYTGIPCGTQSTGYFANGFPVPTGVGSIFAVGQRDKATARMHYDGADATHPLAGTSPNTLKAYVHLPNMPDPNNAVTLPGDPTLPDIVVTAPWYPSYAGNGFNVPITGMQNKFYQTQSLLMDGTLEMYIIDVVPWQDPITKATDGTLTVDAIEGDDFLGEAFICQDIPGSGDLLGAHMYDSAAGILNWITNHPGSEVACNIVVRYSIYDNYIDWILGAQRRCGARHQPGGWLGSRGRCPGVGSQPVLCAMMSGDMKVMNTKHFRSFLAMGALAAACASWGCVADRPARNGVFNENQYVRKDFLVRPASSGAVDPGWIFRSTVVSTSAPNPFSSTFVVFVGADNSGGDSAAPGINYVRFAVTEDKLQMLNMRELSAGYPAQGSREAEIVNAWPITNVDLKYRVNLDGETSNFYEENQELDWQVRQWVKLNFDKNDMSDLAPLGVYAQELLAACSDAGDISTTLVPNSFIVDEPNNYMSWQNPALDSGPLQPAVRRRVRRDRDRVPGGRAAGRLGHAHVLARARGPRQRDLARRQLGVDLHPARSGREGSHPQEVRRLRDDRLGP